MKHQVETWVDGRNNVVTGDYVKFERAVFTGSYPNAKFSHNEVVIGEIVNDSYGMTTGQHTFTILLDCGKKIRIKGRNLYRNGVERLLWVDEDKRENALQNKYERKSGSRFDAYKGMVL